MKQIPNLFTLLNLIFGCIAIVFILQTSESIVLLQQEGFTEVNLPEKITWGCFFIFAAGVVDFLDGFVARLFKATSGMGEQLDSLADVVSFGVAPGLILYQLLRISFAQEENGLDISMAFLLPAFLIPAAAAWRLAKFNLDSEQATSFKGVPTPAVGLVVASFPLIIHFQTFNLQFVFINKWLLYAIIIVLSYLMISNLPLMSMKIKDLSFRNNLARYILLALGIIAAISLKWFAIPVIFLLYVIISLTFKNKTT
jgi:CDP-diacylglycerol---serine O-phosphatidyltransferase